MHLVLLTGPVIVNANNSFAYTGS